MHTGVVEAIRLFSALIRPPLARHCRRPGHLCSPHQTFPDVPGRTYEEYGTRLPNWPLTRLPQ